MHGEVRKIRFEERRIGDAPQKARHVEEWTIPQACHQPQTGDRHRLERGARKGRQGAAAEGITEVLPQGWPEVLAQRIEQEALVVMWSLGSAIGR